MTALALQKSLPRPAARWQSPTPWNRTRARAVAGGILRYDNALSDVVALTTPRELARILERLAEEAQIGSDGGGMTVDRGDLALSWAKHLWAARELIAAGQHKAGRSYGLAVARAVRDYVLMVDIDFPWQLVTPHLATLEGRPDVSHAAFSLVLQGVETALREYHAATANGVAYVSVRVLDGVYAGSVCHGRAYRVEALREGLDLQNVAIEIVDSTRDEYERVSNLPDVCVTAADWKMIEPGKGPSDA